MTVKQFSTVVELIEHAFASHAQSPAYTCLGYTLTYKELEQKSRRFASFLQHELKLKPGDRLALQLPNILQYPIALYGAVLAGVVVVNTNPLYTPRELQFQLKDSGARAIVVLANVAHNLAEIIDQTDVEAIILTEIGDALPWPKRSIVNAVVKHVKKLVPAFVLNNPVRFNDALRLGCEPPDIYRPAPEDLLVLQYTGGTTGTAKGAMLTHGNLCANVRQILNHLCLLFHTPNEQACAALPLYHIFAFNLHALCVFAMGGHNVLIPNPRDIPAFVKALKRQKISLFIAVNTLYNALVRDEAFRSLDFSSLKTSAAGGMAVTEDVARRWYELTGCHICEGYGLTETSPVIITNPDNAVIRGTIGTPLQDTEIKILDDDGSELPAGEPGEICVRGPQVMPGYWQKQEATAEVLTADGWFKTGDIGIRRDDGYYKIVDRKKDMITVSGFKVYPNEVEDVVTQHPGILEAAVIGVPAENVGEHVKLFVVLANGDVTEQEIRDHCRKYLTAYKVPKLIEVRDSLPKTNVGKILRKELRAEV